MYGHDRATLRRFFMSSWRKHVADQPMEPLERLVADIVAQHPEYHRLLTDDYLDQEWRPEQGETNPFLHMGMHVTLAEQIASDRPIGIRSMYRELTAKTGATHAAEHLMMDCLGQVLWEAQRAGQLPDEVAFLDCLRKLRT